MLNACEFQKAFVTCFPIVKRCLFSDFVYFNFEFFSSCFF